MLECTRHAFVPFAPSALVRCARAAPGGAGLVCWRIQRHFFRRAERAVVPSAGRASGVVSCLSRGASCGPARPRPKSRRAHRGGRKGIHHSISQHTNRAKTKPAKPSRLRRLGFLPVEPAGLRRRRSSCVFEKMSVAISNSSEFKSGTNSSHEHPSLPSFAFSRHRSSPSCSAGEAGQAGRRIRPLSPARPRQVPHSYTAREIDGPTCQSMAGLSRIV